MAQRDIDGERFPGDSHIANHGPLAERALWGAWLVLVVATLVAWGLSQASFGAGEPRVAFSAIIVVAFVKMFLVVECFMDLRRGPVGARALFAGWTVLTATGVLYYVART